MAQLTTVSATAATWTAITNADATAITFQNRSGHNMLLKGTADGTAPTTDAGAILYPPFTPQAGAVEIAEATTGTAGLYAFSYLQETAGVVGTLTATIDGGGTSNHYGCTILMQGT